MDCPENIMRLPIPVCFFEEHEILYIYKHGALDSFQIFLFPHDKYLLLNYIITKSKKNCKQLSLIYS